MFNSNYLAEDFRKLSNTLNTLTENNELDSTVSDLSTDKNINNLMTKEKSPDKLADTIDVKKLAADLGITNTSAFQSAFTQLTQGRMPKNIEQITVLALAFDKILSADASTASRVVSKLRQIHKG